jgi:hypothetical protein
MSEQTTRRATVMSARGRMSASRRNWWIAASASRDGDLPAPDAGPVQASIWVCSSFRVSDAYPQLLAAPA